MATVIKRSRGEKKKATEQQKNILLKIMKLVHVFMSTTKKNKINEIGCEYILFRIDVYFSEYLLALESDKNGHTDRDLLFEEKDKEHQKKYLVVNLLELIQVKRQ